MKKPQGPRGPRKMLTWLIPALAIALLGGFLAGERAGARDARGAAPAAGPAGTAAAVDIASMSPEERASHLYDRVMRYGEIGRLDSARIFAPMALQAYAALGTPNAHARYDIGMIDAVAGDSTAARAEAKQILDERPTHLLGLLLAARTAATPVLKQSFERRFVAASAKELATPLPEYADHQTDISGALRVIRGARK